MRSYDITITAPGSTTPVKHWTSYPGGKADPGALNVLFDMPVAPYATPIGMQSVTIEGISLADLTEAYQWATMNLTIKAGMGGGLPLETPSQAGLIAQGYIFQSFGNWVGTEMTLDLVLLPSVFTHETPSNFTLTWPKGATLQSALQATFAAAYKAYPTLTAEFHISADWVNSYDASHAAKTIDGLASYVNGFTYNKPNGPVNITIQRGKILVYDSSYKPPPIQLAFNDLIGQPTWIEPLTMQVKTVLRSDLQIGSVISMPKGYVNNPGFAISSAQSYPSSLKNKSTFSQSFQVNKLRQIGNFRSSDSGEWATILNCVAMGNG